MPVSTRDYCKRISLDAFGVVSTDTHVSTYLSVLFDLLSGFNCRLSVSHVLSVGKYPTGRVVLVMDNASYHKSASALAALSLFEHRVMLVWLPPYCSDLNPIERFWRHVKDLTCANKLQDKIEDVVTSAEKILSQQNMALSTLRFLLSKNL